LQPFSCLLTFFLFNSTSFLLFPLLMPHFGGRTFLFLLPPLGYNYPLTIFAPMPDSFWHTGADLLCSPSICLSVCLSICLLCESWCCGPYYCLLVVGGCVFPPPPPVSMSNLTMSLLLPHQAQCPWDPPTCKDWGGATGTTGTDHRDPSPQKLNRTSLFWS
jgi:hypothetical protein